VAVATLDDALWQRVGRLLVDRGRVTDRELDAAMAECHGTGQPLDDVLVSRGHVSRHTVASAVLVVQLGRDWRRRLEQAAPARAPAPKPQPEPGRERIPDVPIPPKKRFFPACLAVDVGVLVLATLMAAVAQTQSNVAPLPAPWTVAFIALSLGLYWSWRLSTYSTRLRPWADAVLVAGATSLSALIVLTIRSLSGRQGVAEALLPLWAFAVVYGVAGRIAFYLAWPVLEARRTTPDVDAAPADDSTAELEALGPPSEVVPLRPELWALLDELRQEAEAVAIDRRAS
jgi:hypothetical protein